MDDFYDYLPALLVCLMPFIFLKTKPFKNMPKPKRQGKILFSNEENTVRKNWYGALKMLLLGHLTVILAAYSYMVFNISLDFGNEYLLRGFLTVLPILVNGLFIYILAYVDYGVKYLAFFLSTSAVIHLYGIINIFKELLYATDLTNFDLTYMIVANSLTMTLFINYWIQCKRLYESNKKALLASPQLPA